MTVITSLPSLAPGRLKAFDQIPYAQSVGFPMAMTDDWIRAPGRLNQNVRPKDTRRNLHRSDLGNRNALLVAAEQTPLHTAHAQRVDHDARRKPKIPLSPAAGGEGLVGRSRIWTGRSYTHSSAPFFQIHTYPTIRMPRNTSISISPKRPRALNFTAQGNRKIVSTSKTTNRMAMI